MEFNIHPVEWTDEKVSRFWNFQNQYEPFEDIWFTKQVGGGIINFVRRRLSIEGKILDYGTGKGHLIKHLLATGKCAVYGFDFSPESIINVNKKYGTNENYKGTSLIQTGPEFSGFQSNYFDVVFLIEAIEHLTDKYLDSTLAEIRRILKDTGKLVITTPNNENLALQHVMCPDCGGVFHRVQHMRSFNQHTLTELMDEHDFTKVAAGTTNFQYFNDHSFTNRIKRIVTHFRQGYVDPHLWYVGSKKP